MKHSELLARNVAIVEDGKALSLEAICAKYGLSGNYVKRLFCVAGYKLPRSAVAMKRETLHVEICEAAPHSTYAELSAKFGLPPTRLVQILCRHGVRIGRRQNIRAGLTTDSPHAFKQLKILAALKARADVTAHDLHFSRIADQFHVSREYVSQLAMISKSLGLLGGEKSPLPEGIIAYA